MRAWNPDWEGQLYRQGRHLNRYPFEIVVSNLLSRFPDRADREAIRVLEVGFGAGNNLWFAAREGFQTAGIEGSASAAAYAQERFAADGLKGDLRVGDLCELPWPDGSFDVVLDRKSVTHNRPDQIQFAFREMARVLVPGGMLVSELYSDAHPESAHAKEGGRKWADQFPEDSYFHPVGQTAFLDERWIRSLAEGTLRVERLDHLTITSHEDPEAPRMRSAFWQLVATRT